MTRAAPRHLVVGLEGLRPTSREAAWLAEHQPAGVILFSRNIQDYSQLQCLCRVLHKAVPGLEIMVDHEGGAVSQAAAAVGRPPAPWGLGVLGDTGLTARVHEETARRLAAAGIDRVLAPVADVLTEPRNPVIGSRAFGAEPVAVTRQVVAAVTGLLSGGVKVCVKHWPGHGGTDRDTHEGSAAVEGAGTTGPFAAALEAGADAVMAGHLHVDARTAEGVPLPATLDARAIARAKEAWGGRAAMIADDVTMGGLAEAMAGLGVEVPVAEAGGMLPPADLPAAWLDHLVAAGCDRLLVRGIPFAAFPAGPEVAASAGSGQHQAEPPEFDGRSYVQVRDRLGALGLTGFADADRDLVWLDFSSGDRWQAAAGATGCPEDVLAKFRSSFAGVRRVHDPREVPAGVTRLAVSSHRPLAPDALAGLPVEKEGVALVLGHPSLGMDLAAILGHKWRIGALFDVSAEDLEPLAKGPTII